MELEQLIDKAELETGLSRGLCRHLLLSGWTLEMRLDNPPVLLSPNKAVRVRHKFLERSGVQLSG